MLVGHFEVQVDADTGVATEDSIIAQLDPPEFLLITMKVVAAKDDRRTSFQREGDSVHRTQWTYVSLEEYQKRP